MRRFESYRGHQAGPPFEQTHGMRVRFCGVRGSTSAPGQEFVRYGGHTSCVALAHDGARPTLVLDAGTGLRNLTAHLDGHPFRGTILLGHLHWDHTHGLPFFAGGLRPDADVTVVMPAQGDPAGGDGAGLLTPPLPRHPDRAGGELAGHGVRRGGVRHRGLPRPGRRDPPQGRAHVRLPGVRRHRHHRLPVRPQPHRLRRRPRRPGDVPPGGHGPRPRRRRPHPRRPAHGRGVPER